MMGISLSFSLGAMRTKTVFAPQSKNSKFSKHSFLVKIAEVTCVLHYGQHLYGIFCRSTWRPVLCKAISKICFVPALVAVSTSWLRFPRHEKKNKALRFFQRFRNIYCSRCKCVQKIHVCFLISA